MKLFSLSYSLIIGAFTEKGVINVPGVDDADARTKFLQSINEAKVFIHPDTKTFWPMFYTRAVINSSSEFKPDKVKAVDLIPPVLEVKKVRKARGPNKPKPAGKGIKPSNSRRKKV